jgi:hypothetical protein
MRTLAAFKAISPEILTIGRLSYGADPGVNVEGPDLDGDLRREAARVMSSSMRAWEQHRAYVDRWEIINEQDPPGPDGHTRLAEFMFHCMEIGEAEGFTMALFSYPLGVPEWDEMQAVAATGILEEIRQRGHTLALHEYAWPLNRYFGEPIPGRDARPDRGPLAFRYRWWIDAVGGADRMPGIDLTEVNVAHDLRTVNPQVWEDQIGWYLSEVGQDRFVESVQLFGWGSLGDAWEDFDIQRAGLAERWYRLALEAATSEDPAPDPEPDQYDRHVVMADPTYMTADQLDDAYQRGRDELRTVSPSWQDAVPLAGDRPDEWRSNVVHAGPVPIEARPEYVEWIEARDPATTLVFADIGEGPEWAIAAYSQRDSRWADDRLGTSRYTLGEAGCVVTAFASLASQYDPDLTPADVNEWLSENDGYVNGGLTRWAKAGEMVDQLEFVRYHTWRDSGDVADMDVVRRILQEAPAIIQVDFYPGGGLDSHFVLGLEIVDGDLLIMDPWTGTRRRLLEAYGPGRSLATAIFAAAEFREVDAPDPAPETRSQLGFNDHPGPNGTAADWMTANGLGGVIVRPVFLGETAQAYDFRAAAQAGIRVIVNLRYSYSTDHGGGGTMPVMDTEPWTHFVHAAVETMRQSRGIWGWTVLNEANNPREFPHGGRLTAWSVIRTYNVIRDLAGEGFRMAPGALDPYHATQGNPRDWLARIYARIHGAEFTAFHGYVRGPDPALVGSEARFTDAPLEWQYLNYPGCVTALRDALPVAYQDRPLYVTEFNHLWKTVEGDWGWVDDERAAHVIEAAYAAAKRAGIDGLAVYRWAGDDWRVHDNPVVTDAVKRLAV